MTEPWCWISRPTLTGINDLVQGPDRKAARLLLLTLSEMASEALDGGHEGFTSTVREVRERAEFSEPTYLKARRALEAVGALRVERDGGGWRWILTSPEAQTDCASTPKPFVPLAHARVKAEEGKKEAAKAALFDAGASHGASREDKVQIIFERWRTVMPGRQGCRLTPGRRRKILARLQHNSLERLLAAVDRAAQDPFLNGANDRGRPFNDFQTIFRNDEKIDDLLMDVVVAPAPRLTPKQERSARRAEVAQRSMATTGGSQ